MYFDGLDDPRPRGPSPGLFIATVAALLLIALAAIMAAKADEPYDFYNPPPAYRVQEAPNERGETHYIVWAKTGEHSLCGILADVWAKDPIAALRQAEQLVATPGTIICANETRLPVIGVCVEQAGEWRVGVPARPELLKPSESCDIPKSQRHLLLAPGWTLDYRYDDKPRPPKVVAAPQPTFQSLEDRVRELERRLDAVEQKFQR